MSMHCDSLLDFDLIDFPFEIENALWEVSSNISSKLTINSDSIDSASLSPTDSGSGNITVLKKRLLPSPQSTIVSDTNETTKKKKKRYYVPVYTLPRILKRDIRRDYGPMFANVLNSTNFSLMNNFFSTFVTRDCAFIETFYDSTTALQANSPVFNNTTVGQSEIANYLYTIISNFPDFMVKINSNQIIQKSGMVGSIIVFSTSMKGTKVDSLEMLPTSTSNTTTPLPLPIAIPNHVQGIFDDPSVPISEILHTNAWEKTLQQLLPDNPFSAATSLGDVSPPDLIMKDIGCESMLTFYLNEHNLIFKMEGRDQV